MGFRRRHLIYSFTQTKLRATATSALLTALLTGLTACPFLPDHDQGGLPAPDVFLAQNADFGGYRSWPSVLVGREAIVDGHPAGERRVFVSQLPADGDDRFPVGTVIVKEGAGLEVVGGTGGEIHAMVKRGGGFNAGGAVGWEWFELGVANDDTPIIKWRGQEPPDGESYGCLAGSGACDPSLGQCNTCHSSATDNDFVLSPALTIGAFDASLLR